MLEDFTVAQMEVQEVMEEMAAMGQVELMAEMVAMFR